MLLAFKTVQERMTELTWLGPEPRVFQVQIHVCHKAPIFQPSRVLLTFIDSHNNSSRQGFSSQQQQQQKNEKCATRFNGIWDL